MRAIWKGAVTFGLVNVPVKIYAATEDHDIALHQVHDEDGGRIRYQRRCEICGEVVAFEHIDKAYDDGERTVVLTDEDLKSLPAERDREIDVVQFVPTDQVDPIMFDRAYVLEPDGSSPKAYVLLRRTLEQTDRTAIVEFALRQKTRLAALRVRGDLLMLQTLLWADEVRELSFPALDEPTRIGDRELDMSAKLVDSYSDDFEPDRFHDAYQEELRTLIDAKLEQGDALDTAATFGEEDDEAEGGGEVLDLMEALKRSVDRSRQAKGRGSRSSGGTASKGDGAQGDGAKGDGAAGDGAQGDGAKGDGAAGDGAQGGKRPAKTTTARKATSEKKTAEKKTAEKSADEKSADEKPATKKPAAEKPAAKKAAAKKPAAEKPAAGKATTASDGEKAPAKKTAARTRAAS